MNISINLELLNSKNTYILGVIGNDWISKKIQDLSYTNQYIIPKRQRWSHCGILYFNDEMSEWSVIESHFLDKGVTEKSLDYWLLKNKDKYNCLEIISMKCNIKKATYYARQRTPYGTKDVFWLWLLARVTFQKLTWAKLHKPNHRGLTCSELVALCDSNKLITNFYNSDADKIKPNDIKVWAMLNNYMLQTI